MSEPGEISSTIARIIMPFVYKEQKLLDQKMQLWFVRPSNAFKIIIQKEDSKYYVYWKNMSEEIKPIFFTNDLNNICKYLTNIFIEDMEMQFDSLELEDMEEYGNIEKYIKIC